MASSPADTGAGQAERSVEGVDGAADLLGAVGASKSVTRAGAWPGWARACTCSPYKTAAVTAAGKAQAARERKSSRPRRPGLTVTPVQAGNLRLFAVLLACGGLAVSLDSRGTVRGLSWSGARTHFSW